MLTMIQAETEPQITTVRQLFREYESWLGMDLCFQGFEDELNNLPGKYALPEGRLLLAYWNDKVAGCIAMRKIDDGICEMKRLFVREEFQGHKIGVQLIEHLISEAKSEKYSFMRLDTLPSKMGKAAGLYRAHGFYPIAPYYENPYEGVVFMELDLN
jgi:ribosomal protein S18 acetylase RimI-like enzyme